MNSFGLFTFLSILAAPAMDVSPELRVVGVYRPIDLSGRVVNSPREVYLQSVGDGHTLEDMVGVKLDVYRRMPVPASIAMRDALTKDAPDELDEQIMPAQTPSSPSSTKVGESRKTTTIALVPAQALTPVSTGRPAGFAPHKRKGTPAAAISLGSTQPGGDLIVRPQAQPVAVEKIKRFIGRIEIIAVQGDVAVARVISDGLATAKGRQNKTESTQEYLTILVGDIAHKRPAIASSASMRKAKKVSARSKKRLGQERKKIENTLRKRNQKKKPFVRKSMKWDL